LRLTRRRHSHRRAYVRSRRRSRSRRPFLRRPRESKRNGHLSCAGVREASPFVIVLVLLLVLDSALLRSRARAGARLRTSARELGDSLLCEPKNRPLVHWFRAELPVKLDRGIVPIEHRPLHSPTAAL